MYLAEGVTDGLGWFWTPTTAEPSGIGLPDSQVLTTPGYGIAKTKFAISQ